MFAEELARLVEDDAGQEDLAALRQRREARGDVGGDAHNFGALASIDHRELAEVDADADAQGLGAIGGFAAERVLEAEGKADGVGDVGEGDEVAVTGVLENLRGGCIGEGLAEELIVAAEEAQIGFDAEARLDLG